jgi:hypothetical protein
MFTLWFAVAQATTVHVGPYLQSPTPTSVWVLWETDDALAGSVEWGPTTALGETVDAVLIPTPTGSLYEAQLTGLTPGTRTHYRVRSGDHLGEVYDLMTPALASAEAPVRLIAMSDMQWSSSAPGKFEEIVGEGVLGVAKDRWSGDLAADVDLVMIPGDLVDNGWAYEEWRDTFFEPVQPLARHVPLYPVPGNHEANTSAFFRYFHLPANGSDVHLEHWWYADHGNVRIIGLDSNVGYRIAEQIDWLADVLDEACIDEDLDFVFAQLHHPHKSELWLPGELDYTGEVIALLEELTSVCNKPSIHFFGHTHGYSRGQSRDHEHLWVNVATAGGAIDYWGEQEQQDYEEFVVSTDDWGFVVVEVEAGDDPSYRLQRVSRGNRDGLRDNVVTDEITVRRDNLPPRRPTGLYPVDQEVGPACVVLVASSTIDPDGGEHAASHWRLDEGCDGELTPDLERWRQSRNEYGGVDLAAGDDLTDEVFEALTPGASWCWRVRYRDDSLGWSRWSPVRRFTTGLEQAEPVVGCERPEGIEAAGDTAVLDVGAEEEPVPVGSSGCGCRTGGGGGWWLWGVWILRRRGFGHGHGHGHGFRRFRLGYWGIVRAILKPTSWRWAFGSSPGRAAVRASSGAVR